MNGLTLAELSTAVHAFSRYTTAENSWAEFRQVIAPQADLGLAEHRGALLRWLNAAGCRIRYPRAGEHDFFDAGIAEWWQRWRTDLPAPTTALTDLTDDSISLVGACFDELSAIPAALARRPRPLGPTAGSKLLHAVRPYTLLPWDAAIAKALHGSRDGLAFARHQALGRSWGRAILKEAGTDEASLATRLGVPGRPLAKMLDDYCYLAFTANSGKPTDRVGG